jgi:type IV pilus assembly protein PilB
VQAALTGHLVLSTIHTNNAAGVIPRLIDMGVDPFLIAPTLICAIAQRLVRELCPGGGRAVPVEGLVKTTIDNTFADLPEEFRSKIEFGKEVYEAQPTPECPKGTMGRLAVMEVLEMNKEIEKIILTNPTELDIMKAARKNGMLTLKEDAMIKAFQKKIPFEEATTL